MLKERECFYAYVPITKAKESFLKQKARNQWLQLGDQNNSFFHRSFNVQNVKNTLTHSWDEHVNRMEDIKQIKQMCVNFYKMFNEGKVARIKQLIPDAIFANKVVLLENEVTLEEIRDTLFLTLVPKKVNPPAMGDLRPIACCNVIYKYITKIILNRMLPLLGDLVSMNQSTFILSRSIFENVLLA